MTPKIWNSQELSKKELMCTEVWGTPGKDIMWTHLWPGVTVSTEHILNGKEQLRGRVRIKVPIKGLHKMRGLDKMTSSDALFHDVYYTFKNY